MDATRIDEVMTDEVNYMEAHEPASHAKRRMDTNELRSLLVVEDDRPVGMIQWNRLRRASDDELTQPVSVFITTDFPTIRQGESIEEVNSRVHQDINVDQVPVVSDSGTMVGGVNRNQLALSAEPAGGTTDESGEPPRQSVPVHEGMTVKDSHGSKLGSLTEAEFKTDGGVEFLIVEHGLLFKHQKRLPGDLIKDVQEDDVLLAIDSQEFGMMQNVGEEA